MSLHEHPNNPIPAGAHCDFVETPDRVRIRYAHWPAAGKRRLGTVTLLQGRAEFIERYFEVIEDLRARGFAVVAFDWRGQGGSQRVTRNPNRGHISNFKKFRLDLRTVLKKVSLATYPGPHFALAHSTGALVLLSDSERLRTMLDRAVLVAPLLGYAPGSRGPEPAEVGRKLLNLISLGLLGKPGLKTTAPKTSAFVEKLGYPVARVLSAIGFGRLYTPGGGKKPDWTFENNGLTSDRTRFERSAEVQEAAPELAIRGVTFGWLSAATRTMKSFRRRDAGPNMKLPCLVFAAGNDQIVSTPMIEDFVARTKAAAYVEIPGAGHEIMMERDIYREQFWAAFDAFIPGLEAEQDLERASRGEREFS
ncbi:alpha/beta fold hydrolase [Roseibium aggregatum]|uniref:Alpha/beta hydrolase n=1 Tax=Roseibium aggregatum TaxID=187304 RepID=A0A939J642_9HYPH|nr:alpha/beta hydrolase [Roseibium aggregatum]MBN9672404.1 alpha/beta hydrolase [Roseibium aggregatum]